MKAWHILVALAVFAAVGCSGGDVGASSATDSYNAQEAKAKALQEKQGGENFDRS